MRNKQEFTLDVISSIDEDIVNDNLNKRFALWFSRAQKKKNYWIPIVAMAAVFAIIVSSIFLFLPDNSHVAPPSDKQVPIYQGMTVSNEAPVVEMEARVNYSMPLFGAIGARLKPTPKPNKDTPAISGGPYYAQPNEDIYIYVHISNPDGFEILSFTLNGVKYSTYMFEAGSDLETLILKYNVGEKEGIQQYTIDAIKYVDGENIKDVRMEGERTIEVLVGNDAQDLTFATQFDGWDLVITPKWAGTFAGEKKILSLAVYDGERLLRELTPSTTVIKDLPMDKRLLLVATYLDNGKTVTVKTVFQTLKQSEGLIVVGGVVTGIGACTDTVLYINMPIADDAFSDNKQIKQVYMGGGVTSIGERAFEYCQNLENIVFSDQLESIGDSAFQGCNSLKNIVIPDSVTHIDEGLFAGCSLLEAVTISRNTAITSNMFYNCKSLKRIVVPDGVTEIGWAAFQGCSALMEIYLPKSVTTIGVTAFWGCGSLSAIHYDGTIEQWKQIEKDPNGLSPVTITVYCSDGEVTDG